MTLNILHSCPLLRCVKYPDLWDPRAAWDPKEAVLEFSTLCWGYMSVCRSSSNQGLQVWFEAGTEAYLSVCPRNWCGSWQAYWMSAPRKDWVLLIHKKRKACNSKTIILLIHISIIFMFSCFSIIIHKITKMISCRRNSENFENISCIHIKWDQIKIIWNSDS